MSLSRLSWPLEAPHKWAAAALLVALSFALRTWLADVTGPSVPFLFAFPAVFAAAWLGGLGPGLFATALCVVGYAALAWLGGIKLEGLLLRGALFTASAAIMCVMAEQLHRSRRHLQSRSEAAERAAAEAQRLASELKMSQAQFQLFVENTPGLAWLKNADLDYVFVNDAVARRFGIAKDDWVGKSDFELLPREIAARMRERDERALREGRSMLEPPRQQIAGRYYLAQRFRVPMPDGRFGVGGNSFDVSEQMVVEAQLAQALQQLELLISNTPLAVVAWDSDFRITRWAGEAERLFGWRAEEMVGKQLWECGLVYPQDQPRMHEAAEELQRANRFVVSRNRNLTRSGEVRSCEWYNSVLRDEHGGLSAVLSLVLDVTERERALRQLREADLRKDTFVATLAHELRNPLAPMLNAAHVLSEHFGDDAVAGWATHVIERQVMQMARLLDDLLDISRITFNRLELRRQPVRIDEVLDSAIEQSRPMLEQANQALQVDRPAQALYLNGDPVRLAQVFANLLNNAAKYSTGAGTVHMCARAEGDELVIEVRDQGMGIAPEAIGSIFEIFVRSGPAAAGSQAGLGIGLSLVSGLVALHGGTVHAASAGVGHGSVFTVRLPRLHQEPPAPGQDNPAPAAVPAPQRLRVLVVDDNRDNTDSMCFLLRSLGYDCLPAYDGREALSEGERFRPHAVLLDIGLPDMSGYEVAGRMRRTPWGERTLLVAMTGWGQAEDKRMATEAGFDRHFTKPVEIGAITELLQTIALHAR